MGCTRRIGSRLAALSLLLLCGCSLAKVGHWFGFGPPGAHPDPNLPLNLAPVGLPHPGLVQAAHSAHENVYDQASFFSQQLAALEDDRRVLLARLHEMEQKLFEKEQAIVLAGKETQAAMEEVERSRQEVQQWQKDVGELRTRLRNVEQEDRKSLEQIVNTLEHLWERQKAREAKGD